MPHWDPLLLPVLVVTSDESDSAKCFTLLHEYAHVLLRSAAACLESEDNTARGQIERWCNRFAGAVLVPPEALEQALGPLPRKHGHLLDVRALTNAASRLQVSRDVIVIRLEQLELVPAGFYNSLKHEFVRDSLKAVRIREGEIRIPLHRRRLTELGFSLPLAVMRAHERGFLDVRETAELLDVGADGLPALATAANEARSQSV